MHHDFFNDNEKVDCGNWISHIFNEYGRENIYFKWIANPISLDVYGFTSEEKSIINAATSLEDICDEKYDYIFLCRSDNWLPPHLDREFYKITDVIRSHFLSGSVVMQDLKAREIQDIVALQSADSKDRR